MMNLNSRDNSARIRQIILVFDNFVHSWDRNVLTAGYYFNTAITETADQLDITYSTVADKLSRMLELKIGETFNMLLDAILHKGKYKEVLCNHLKAHTPSYKQENDKAAIDAFIETI